MFAPHPLAALPIDCLIEPRSMVRIAAAEEGRIEEVLVSRGDAIAAGDPLIRLDDQVQALRAEIARARAGTDLDIRSGETRLELRREELARAERLAERNVGALTSVDEARIEVALTEIAIEEARLAAAQAAIEAQLTEEILARRTVRAPLAGVVVAVEVSPGEYARREDEVLTLAIIDPLYVEVFASAAYFNRLDIGDTYMVSQTTPIVGSFKATVTVIDQVFDAASNTFGVRLELPNPDGGIPAGTRCKVDFDAPSQ